ncbi:Lrp/AsnC family transcriptional regulator [Desulfogranum japonicum]|uniref:Lrp/AsnC family transcriptional regulator n=1 Tax=Desulfogranum japonicum TaxID=231447 RepID=UPI000406AE09|nr:Lrp/AsnC family transcriptional regulator [Desulfogranum japonicum]
MDELDRKILKVLQKNGKFSNVQLAEKVALSESACLRRVKLLEESGIIERYVMLVNQRAVGLGNNAFVRVTLDGQQRSVLSQFEEAIHEVPEVMECYMMSGEADYLLRIICRDNDDYIRIHDVLTNLPGVHRVQTSFALRAVVKKTEIPL